MKKWQYETDNLMMVLCLYGKITRIDSNRGFRLNWWKERIEQELKEIEKRESFRYDEFFT